MKISKKSQYALKAIFELAWRNGTGLVKTHEIADVQQMSARFTEIILNELKHGGFVESKRGNEGGYMLLRDAGDLTIREVIECIEGPISVVPKDVQADVNSTLRSDDLFEEVWDKVNNAVCKVLGNTTFAELVEAQRAKRRKGALNYNI